MNVELYYYDQCPYCQRVLTKIKRLGLTKVEYRNTLENKEYRTRHMKKTGRTTVPCLYINGEPLFESADICVWLEEHANDLK